MVKWEVFPFSDPCSIQCSPNLVAVYWSPLKWFPTMDDLNWLTGSTYGNWVPSLLHHGVEADDWWPMESWTPSCSLKYTECIVIFDSQTKYKYFSTANPTWIINTRLEFQTIFLFSNFSTKLIHQKLFNNNFSQS